MLKLKDLLKEQKQDHEDIKILRRGLSSVQSRSHLVSDQIRKNIDQFFDNLSREEFVKEFGRVKDFLGAGVFGAAYKLQDGKVLKVTFDYHEAPFLYDLMQSPKEGMVDVDKVSAFPFGDTTAYGIVRDPLTPVTETQYRSEVREVLSDMKRGRFNKEYETQKKKEAKTALMSMYEMDPNWRGTHLENLGIQNGRVVLYDGFSKGVEKSASKVPTTDLSK